MDVASLIDRAGIDENDRDMGTSGLCGVFGLSLYRELARRGIASEIIFLSAINKAGTAQYQYDSGLHYDLSWRHVMIRVEGRYFDVDGEVLLEHAIENYCWGNLYRGGVPVPVTFKQATDILRKARLSSYDERYRRIWRNKLRAA